MDTQKPLTLALMSDTHMRHGMLTGSLAVPPCDVLIHAGDFSARGTWGELEDFAEWLGRQPARRKLVVAGNHDAQCEEDAARARATFAAAGVDYLCDEGLEVEGLRVWGSPWTPTFNRWSFMKDAHLLKAHFEAIPEGLDVLVTHGPPRGVGDMTLRGATAGCDALRARVVRVRPRLHVFGHIHEGSGTHRVEGVSTVFVNAACAPFAGRAARPPVLAHLAPRQPRDVE